MYKEKPICPQCKVPFSSLLTFRTVDGELHDYPCQESVGMLKRAPWFQEHLKVSFCPSAPKDMTTSGVLAQQSHAGILTQRTPSKGF